MLREKNQVSLQKGIPMYKQNHPLTPPSTKQNRYIHAVTNKKYKHLDSYKIYMQKHKCRHTKSDIHLRLEVPEIEDIMEGNTIK